MINIADADLNKFAPEATRTDFVPPSEESIFILTSDQLQTIIKETIQSLQDEIMDLRATAASQNERIIALEATQDTQAENQLILLQLINDLRKGREPRPMQRDRGELLRALLAANGGKMLLKEARQKMHLSKPRFSELLATMVDEIETKPYHLNKSAKVLILKSSA